MLSTNALEIKKDLRYFLEHYFNTIFFNTGSVCSSTCCYMAVLLTAF